MELFSQTNIGRTVATADGSFQRPFQGKTCATDALKRGGRKRVATLLHSSPSGLVDFPFERGFEGLEDTNRCVHDFRADAVSRN
jgi:hypothetical protein